MIIIFLLFSLAFAQGENFNLEIEGIPLNIEDWSPFAPWYGGNAYSTPEFADIDADSDFDLFIGDGGGNLIYLENIGDIFYPNYSFITFNFDSLNIYGGMTKLNFVDLDADGDLDLYITTSYYPNLFINIGTPSSYQFELIEDTLIQNFNITSVNFTDIDSDDDYDLFAADINGDIFLYLNNGTPQIWEYNEPIILIDYPSYVDWIKVSLCDIDNDNDYDLFFGDDDGEISYYRNEGDSLNYNFIFMTDHFAGISVTGYSTPTFCDIDGDDDYDFFVGMGTAFGSNQYFKGNVAFYENQGTPEQYDFVHITDNYLCFDVGGPCKPVIVDIDDDGDGDLIPGRSGFSFPLVRNIGTAGSPAFLYEDDTFCNISTGNANRPCFGDLDSDGDYDLLLGNIYFMEEPFISYYENIGTPEEPYMRLIEFQYITGFLLPIIPQLVDIDDDGDLDLFVGTSYGGDGTIYYYQNIGNPFTPNFQLMTQNYQNISYASDISQHFVDYDYDGDYDLFTTSGGLGYGIRYYENTGTPNSANFELVTEEFAGLEEYWSVVYFYDIDNDNDLDLFIGKAEGGIKFYRNQSNPSSPALSITLSYPDVILHWLPIAGADYYQIFTDTIPYFLPAGLPAFTIFPPDTSWIDAGAVNMGKRFYRVVAGN